MSFTKSRVPPIIHNLGLIEYLKKPPKKEQFAFITLGTQNMIVKIGFSTMWFLFSIICCLINRKVEITGCPWNNPTFLTKTTTFQGHEKI